MSDRLPAPEAEKPIPIQQEYSPFPRKNSFLRSLFLIGFLFFFNLIFILGPFIGLWATVFGFIITAITLTISGLVIVVSGFFSFPLSFLSIPILIMEHPTLLFSTGFLLIGLGGLLSIGLIYLIHFFGRLTIKYTAWNIKVIRGY